MTEAMVIPDGITPVVGWRAWEVDGRHLKSPSYEYVWPERTAAKATCHQRSFGPRRYHYVRPHAGSQFDFASTCPRCGLVPATPSGIGHAVLCAMRAAKQDTEQ